MHDLSKNPTLVFIVFAFLNAADTRARDQIKEKCLCSFFFLKSYFVDKDAATLTPLGICASAELRYLCEAVFKYGWAAVTFSFFKGPVCNIEKDLFS